MLLVLVLLAHWLLLLGLLIILAHWLLLLVSHWLLVLELLLAHWLLLLLIMRLVAHWLRYLLTHWRSHRIILVLWLLDHFANKTLVHGSLHTWVHSLSHRLLFLEVRGPHLFSPGLNALHKLNFIEGGWNTIHREVCNDLAEFGDLSDDLALAESTVKRVVIYLRLLLKEIIEGHRGFILNFPILREFD